LVLCVALSSTPAFTTERAALRPAIVAATVGGERGATAAMGRTADSPTEEGLQAGLAPARNSSSSTASSTYGTDALLDRVGRYVLRYADTFRNLVAVETYTQWAGQQGGGRLRRRVLRSDILFVSLPTDIPWTVFRDVFEVDGRPVRDRQARLVRLFKEDTGTIVERANAILLESARFNLGPAFRTVKIPTLALLFLHPENQDRFVFRRGREERVGGHDATVLGFDEVSRPTFVHEGSHRDLPAKGRFWIEPDRGLVVRSEVEYRFESGRAVGVVSTDFRPEPGFDIWVPAEMRERYEDLPEAGPHTRVFGEPVEGTARYSHYQRFWVAVIEEKARLPEDAPAPPR
jgi:hypothetical protein